MTIQMRFQDAERTKTYTYRKVYKGKNLAQYRESFEAQRNTYHFGILVQLKGKERIVLAFFGVPTVDDYRLKKLMEVPNV